jgi:transposase InsO family protein
LEKSRQSFAKRSKISNQKVEQFLKFENQLRTVRMKHPRMGLRKIFYKESLFEQIGVNQFETYFIAKGYGVVRKRAQIRTTNSRYTDRYYDNLINGFVLTRINELIVGDITYYTVGSCVYYISFLLDVYSLRIVGHSVDINMRTELCTKSMKMVEKLRGRQNIKEMIHHTDKGSQYGSIAYTNNLKGNQVQISMAETCLENGYAERINGIIKEEYLDFEPINNLNQMKKALEHAVKMYNEERPIKRHGYLTPIEFENGVKPKTKQTRKIKLHDFRA